MTSSRGNVNSNTAKEEQMVAQFFSKTLHTILESRSPYLSYRNYSGGDEAASSPSSSSWNFRIALRECPAALENNDFRGKSNHGSMVVDVILVKPSLDWYPTNFSPKGDFAKNPPKEEIPNFMKLELRELGMKPRNEKVIERWVVQYESRKSRDCTPWSKRFFFTSYKKLVVLLRSLYLRMRLLPAYKLFRDLISCGKIRKYTLKHRVSSVVEPFPRREEGNMQRFSFTPVDTSCGRLCLSVSYRASLSDVSSEPSTPFSPQLIPDYVGSPLADPLKRFPSLPGSHCSPSCSPFSRSHSWSSENYQASSPSTFPSPSSDSHVSISKFRSQLPPPMRSPYQLNEAFQAGGKTIGSDEYWPSPAFSTSPSPSPSPSQSPSPPTYTAKTNASKALLRCESAPLGIPTSKAFNKQNLPPSSPPKLTRAATSKSDKLAGATGSSVETLFTRRYESGRFSGVRLSILDDFDDSEFACHFAADYADMTGSGSRAGSDQKEHTSDSHEPKGSTRVRKSQDAEVGALVLMLKKAPSLRQDTLAAFKEQQSHKGSGLSSRYSLLKTTADSLEELQGHKELKELLISQGYVSRGAPPDAKPK